MRGGFDGGGIGGGVDASRAFRSGSGAGPVGWVFCALLLVAGSGLAGQLDVGTNDGLAIGLAADGAVTSLRLDGAELAGSTAPLLVLRDLSAAGTVFEPNLLANPGFEAGLDHWQEVQSSGVHGVLVESPTCTGGGALELSGGSEEGAGWAAWAADPVAVSPGQRLRAGAWWRSPQGFLVEDSGTAPALQMLQWRKFQSHTGLYVQWLDGAGRPVGDTELAVALHMNCSTWRLTRRELVAPAGAAAARLIVGAKLFGETVVVDDLSLVPATEPDRAVTGAVTPCAGEDDCVELDGSELGGLRVTARIAGEGAAIRIDGTVSDTSGSERAFDLKVEIPVAAGEGWTWWDDAHVSRPVAGDGTFEHAVSAVADGWLPISLYPYGGLGSSSGGTGLALALPPATPQLGEIVYDAGRRLLAVIFHLGISPLAEQLHGTARFSAVLFRADPAWGFRDIIRRYRDLFAAAFAPHVRLYGFSGRSQGDYSSRAGVAQAGADDAANVYSAEYTSADLPIKVAASEAPRPVFDDLMTTLDQLAQSSDERTRAFAAAVSRSAVVDTNGEWMLKHVIVPPWAPGWWEASWIAGMDPELAGGLAQWNLRYRIDAAFAACATAGVHLDGVQIDNFMSTPSFDFRPEAVAAAGESLGYSPHTYRPAVHNGFAVREYLEQLRRHLDETWGPDRGITINFWGIAHPYYLAPYIDGFGSEGNLGPDGTGRNWNLEIEDYRRALADRRPYLFTNQTVGFTEEQARLFTGPAILFGVPSGTGPNGHGWEPAAEEEVERAADLVFTFWSAGWEPVTWARSADATVLMERFGRTGPERDPAAPPGIFFTVYNPGDTERRATLTIDLAGLGLATVPALRLTDLATGEPIAFARQAGALTLDLDLDPRQTRVLHLLPGPRASRPAGRHLP